MPSLSRKSQIRLLLNDIFLVIDLGDDFALVETSEGHLGLTTSTNDSDVVLVESRDFDTTLGRPALGRTKAQLDALAIYLDEALLAGEISSDRKVFLPVGPDHELFAK